MTFCQSESESITLKKDCVDLNKVEAVDGIAEMVTVECVAETLSKVTENATEITQLPDKCHVKSFAEIVTKDAEYFAKVFSSTARSAKELL